MTSGCLHTGTVVLVQFPHHTPYMLCKACGKYCPNPKKGEDYSDQAKEIILFSHKEQTRLFDQTKEICLIFNAIVPGVTCPLPKLKKEFFVIGKKKGKLKSVEEISTKAPTKMSNCCEHRGCQGFGKFDERVGMILCTAHKAHFGRQIKKVGLTKAIEIFKSIKE